MGEDGVYGADCVWAAGFQGAFRDASLGLEGCRV